MADQRDGGIAWCDETWNPVRGCSRVSAGCENCYAERVAGRFSGPGAPYEGLARIGKNGARWTGAVRLVPEHLADPLRWKRPRRVFVNSMSDLFHEGLTNEEIAAVFGIMAAAPRHTFQVLTKRAQGMWDWFKWLLDLNVTPAQEIYRRAAGYIESRSMEDGATFSTFNGSHMAQSWPLPNVWLGVSAEDQATADERIPFLRAVPAAVRWVSYEPALGPVDLSKHMWPVHWSWDAKYKNPEAALAAGAHAEQKRQALVSAHAGFLNWFVVGGESGPGARLFDLAWARSVVEQCKLSDTACFVKQLGARPIDGAHLVGAPSRIELRDRKGGDWDEWPEALRVREFPR